MSKMTDTDDNKLLLTDSDDSGRIKIITNDKSHKYTNQFQISKLEILG